MNSILEGLEGEMKIFFLIVLLFAEAVSAEDTEQILSGFEKVRAQYAAILETLEKDCADARSKDFGDFQSLVERSCIYAEQVRRELQDVERKIDVLKNAN